MAWRLINANTGESVKIGDELTDFRGGKALLTGMREPHGSYGAGGRVYVKKEGGDRQEYELFPSVFELTWIQVEPSTTELPSPETIAQDLVEEANERRSRRKQ